MVYKRYVKIGGKKYGPYEYESYRDKDGKSRTRYMEKCTVNKKFNFGILSLSLIIAISSLLIVFFIINNQLEPDLFSRGFYEISFDLKEISNEVYSFITGLTTEGDDSVVEESEEESDSKDFDGSSIDESETVVEETEETTEVEEEPEDEEVGEVPEESEEETEQEEEVLGNETEIPEDQRSAVPETSEPGEEVPGEEPETNETIVEEENETVSNESIVNETEIEIPETNETVKNDTGVVVADNETISNATIGNETQINETVMNESVVNETELNATIKNARIIINRPVKWIEIFNATKLNESGNFIVVIPKDSQNISVKTGVEVQEALNELNVFEETIENSDRNDIVSGAITGLVSVDIDLNKGAITKFIKWLKKITITGKVVQEEELQEKITETEENKEVNLTDVYETTLGKEIAVEYYTDAPTAVETETSNGKRVVVSGPDELNYTDVLSYVGIQELYDVGQENRIKIYWYNYDIKEESIGEEVNETTVNDDKIEAPKISVNETIGNVSINISLINDSNNFTLDSQEVNPVEQSSGDPETFESDKEVPGVDANTKDQAFVKEDVNFTALDLDLDGKIDYVEWNVPHLSNQTFEIILITKAEHLDSNRTFISDIYNEVKELDGNWSETIPSEHYVRVTFEINLTFDRDITIYPRNVSGNPKIEVYEINGNELIASFDSLIDNEYNKVLLTNLNGSQDVFDLKILNGSLEFDHIIDPFQDNGSLIQYVYDCGELNTTGATYLLNQSLTTTTTCFNITANNITLDGKGFNIDGNDTGGTYGVKVIGRINITIKNMNITDFGGGIYFAGTNNSFIISNNLSSNSDGINFVRLNNNLIENNTISNSGSSGIYFDLGAHDNNIRRNIIRFSSLIGVSIVLSDNTTLEDNILNENTVNGINIDDSSGTTITNGLINGSKWDAIDISGGAELVINTNLTNVTITNTNLSFYDFILSAGDVNETSFIDMPHIGNYSFNAFTGAGGTIIVKNSQFGEIKFLSAVNGTGTNLTRDIRILNNSVEVRSDLNPGLNRSANVTLYGLPTNYVLPEIKRNGVTCGAICNNFTSLNAGNVTFNVSYWTNYSIEDSASLISCGNLTTAGTTYTLQNNVNTTGTCFNITANNITLDGKGFNIDGNDTGGTYGVVASGRLNITIKNLNISDFDRGINFDSVNSSLIINNSLTNNAQYGIYLRVSENNLITNNTINNNNHGIIVGLISTNTSIERNIVDSNSANGITASSSTGGLLIQDNNASSNGLGLGGSGIVLTASTSSVNVINNTLNLNEYGISVSTSSSNRIEGGNINGSTLYGIIISGGTSDNNNFTNIEITNTNSSVYDLVFLSVGDDGTSFIDMPHIGNYTFDEATGAEGTIIVKNSQFGEIKFLSAVNGTGTNLTRDIRILNNSVEVRSDLNPGLNRSANVTLYGIGDRGFSFTELKRNGLPCGSVCSNFTNLTAPTVTFNVSYWTNYSVGERDNLPPKVTIDIPDNVTYNISSFPLNFTVSLNENGSVFYSLDNGRNNITMYASGVIYGLVFNHTNVSIADGNYKFLVFANDTAGNKNYTENVTFSVQNDVISPNVIIRFPNSTTYNSSDFPLNFNVTLNENGSVMYSLDNGTNNYSMYNSSGGFYGTNFNRTNESMSDGNYTFRVYANDTTGNKNYSKSVGFTVEADGMPPGVKILSPEAKTYTSLPIVFTISTSEPVQTALYSLNNGTTNTTMFVNGSSTGFTNNENSLNDGTYTAHYYTNDTAGNRNDSESVTFFLSSSGGGGEGGGGAGSAGGGGGSGGGGSGGIFDNPIFTTNTRLLEFTVKQGESDREVIRVTNIDKETHTFETWLGAGLGELTKLSQTAFSLAPGESKEIVVDVSADESQTPDTYFGIIYVAVGGTRIEVNTVIEVKEKQPLFDVLVKMERDNVLPGEHATGLIEILNLGDKQDIDVFVEYRMMDFQGNKITFGKESIAIEDKLSLSRSLLVPIDLAIGAYIFEVDVSYNEVSAHGSKTFNVAGDKALSPIFSSALIKFIIWALMIFVIVAILTVLIVIVVQMRNKKSVQAAKFKKPSVVYVGGSR